MATGRPTDFTPELAQEIVDSVSKVLTIRQCANLCGLTHPTILDWLKQGDADRRNKIVSEKAIFSTNMRVAQAKEVMRLVSKLDDGRKTWGAQAWLLERCFREDFGADSDMIKEIKDNHAKILELLEKKDG